MNFMIWMQYLNDAFSDMVQRQKSFDETIILDSYFGFVWSQQQIINDEKALFSKFSRLKNSLFTLPNIKV